MEGWNRELAYERIKPMTKRTLVWHKTNQSDRVRCSICREFVKWTDDGLFGEYVIGHAKVAHGVFPWDASWTDDPFPGQRR
jgi:hypothetical protein